jgi:L-rhamnose isomerase/sugar isomerase
MIISQNIIDDHNAKQLAKHKTLFDFAKNETEGVESIIQRLIDFQVAIPSWALGTGGTRFGRFPGGGEPRRLEEKIEGP